MRRIAPVIAILGTLLALGLAPERAQAVSEGPSVDPAAARTAAGWLQTYRELASVAPRHCPRVTMPTLSEAVPSRAFVLSVPTGPDAESPLVATIKDPIVERFIVLSEDANGCVHVSASGRALPFRARSLFSPFPNGLLPESRGATPSVAIVVDHKSVRPWVEVMSAERFQRISERLWLLLAMFTGMLATLCMVSILVAYYRPSTLVRAYVVYIIALQLYQLQALGLGAAWLPFWPPAHMHQTLQALAAGTAVLGISLPVFAFLRPRGGARIALIVFTGLTAAGFYLSALDAFSYRFGSATLLLLSMLLVVVLVRRLSTGEPAMRWFAIGLTAAIAGGGTQAATIALQGAWMPPMTAYAFPLGNVVESVCWLIAILMRLRAENLSLEQQLLDDAEHDWLTGLYRRAYVHRRIEELIADCRAREHCAIGLIYIDLGDLRQINNRFGQASGDEAIKTFATALRELKLDIDSIGRYHGDEFVVLMNPDAHWSQTEGAAATILGRFREPFVLRDCRVLVRPDLAILRIDQSYGSADEVIRDANYALQVTKQLGGRRTTQFEPAMRDRAEAEHALRHRIEEAIRQDRLELHYQPVVELEGLSPIGFEALLRWQLPGREAIGVHHALTVAEASGLLPALGERIVDMALHQLATWQHQGVWSPTFFLSINVCEQQMLDGRLLKHLHSGLHRYGIDATAVRLEIAERSLGIGGNDNWSQVVLPHLLNQFVLLGIDNFGDGLASLTTLTDLQPDYLKLDRRLVSSVARLPRAQSLARSSCLLATNIGCMAIAEGIETLEQLETLRDLGFEHGQGTFIAAPMSGQDIVTWVQLSDGRHDAGRISISRERRQVH